MAASYRLPYTRCCAGGSRLYSTSSGQSGHLFTHLNILHLSIQHVQEKAPLQDLRKFTVGIFFFFPLLS
jgi:hypothetical protein